MRKAWKTLTFPLQARDSIPIGRSDACEVDMRHVCQICRARERGRQANCKAAAKPKTVPTPQIGNAVADGGSPAQSGMIRQSQIPFSGMFHFQGTFQTKLLSRRIAKFFRFFFVKSSMVEHGMRPCDPQPLLTPQSDQENKSPIRCYGALRASQNRNVPRCFTSSVWRLPLFGFV